MNTPYIPHPIAGQPFKGHIKCSLAQVRKCLERNGSFEGFIVGNNVNSLHFFGGWHLAHNVTFNSMEEMEKHLNAFLFYLEPELGKRAAFYMKKPLVVQPLKLTGSLAWENRNEQTAE